MTSIRKILSQIGWEMVRWMLTAEFWLAMCRDRGDMLI